MTISYLGNLFFRSAKLEGQRTVSFRMIPQVSNIVCLDQNSGGRCQYSKGSETLTSNSLLDHIIMLVVKYLKIFHLGVGGSTGLLRTNWEMSLTNSTPLMIICSRYLKIVDGKRRVSHVSRSRGSVCHFDVALLRKFTNCDDFAPTVQYHLVLCYYLLL